MVLVFFLDIIILFNFASFIKLNPKRHTTVDEHRHKILVTLVFFMVIQHVIIIFVALQQLALHQHYNAMMTMVVFIMQTNGISREIFVWNYD